MLQRTLPRLNKFQTKSSHLLKPFNKDSLLQNLNKIRYNLRLIQSKLFERKEFRNKISQLTQLQN